MTKQKQIEDFAEAIICAAITANAKIDDKVAIHLKEFTENLYNAGYRKVPVDTLILTENQLKKIIEEEYKNALKGKVVLTTEEYQDLVVKSMGNFSSAMVEARKETAEKIFKMLISKLDSNQFLSGKRIIMEVDVENLAKQFDVEIKE